jgi:hypothetical protein
VALAKLLQRTCGESLYGAVAVIIDAAEKKKEVNDERERKREMRNV